MEGTGERTPLSTWLVGALALVLSAALALVSPCENVVLEVEHLIVVFDIDLEGGDRAPLRELR